MSQNQQGQEQQQQQTEEDHDEIPLNIYLLVLFNRFRRQCATLVQTRFFIYSSLLVITFNSILLTRHRFDGSAPLLEFLNHICTFIFTIELGVRIFAGGWRRFVTDGWDFLDLVSILTSLLAAISYIFFADDDTNANNNVVGSSHGGSVTAQIFGSSSALANISALRVFRWLLPVVHTDASRMPASLRLLTATIFRSIKGVLDVTALAACLILLYAVAGYQIFGGFLDQRCYITGIANNKTVELNYRNNNSTIVLFDGKNNNNNNNFSLLQNNNSFGNNSNNNNITFPLLIEGLQQNCGVNSPCPSSLLGDGVTVECLRRTDKFESPPWQNFNTLPASYLVSLDVFLTGDWSRLWDYLSHSVPTHIFVVSTIFNVSLATLGNWCLVAIFLTISATAYSELAPIFVVSAAAEQERDNDGDVSGNSSNNSQKLMGKKSKCDAVTWVNLEIDSNSNNNNNNNNDSGGNESNNKPAENNSNNNTFGASSSSSSPSSKLCDALTKVPKNLNMSEYLEWTDLRIATRIELEQELEAEQLSMNQSLKERAIWIGKFFSSKLRKNSEDKRNFIRCLLGVIVEHPIVDLLLLFAAAMCTIILVLDSEDQTSSPDAFQFDSNLISFLNPKLFAQRNLLLLGRNFSTTTTTKQEVFLNNEIFFQQQQQQNEHHHHLEDFRDFAFYISSWCFIVSATFRLISSSNGIWNVISSLNWLLEVGISVRGFLSWLLLPKSFLFLLKEQQNLLLVVENENESENNFNYYETAKYLFLILSTSESLLRVFFSLKLIELFPPFASAFRSAFRSLKNTLYLAALTILVLYVFSVLGFHLFGAFGDDGPFDELSFSSWYESFLICFIIISPDIVIPPLRYLIYHLHPLVRFLAFFFVFSIYIFGRGLIVNIMMSLSVEDLMASEKQKEENRYQQQLLLQQQEKLLKLLKKKTKGGEEEKTEEATSSNKNDNNQLITATTTSSTSTTNTLSSAVFVENVTDLTIDGVHDLIDFFTCSTREEMPILILPPTFIRKGRGKKKNKNKKKQQQQQQQYQINRKRTSPRRNKNIATSSSSENKNSDNDNNFHVYEYSESDRDDDDNYNNMSENNSETESDNDNLDRDSSSDKYKYYYSYSSADNTSEDENDDQEENQAVSSSPSNLHQRNKKHISPTNFLHHHDSRNNILERKAHIETDYSLVEIEFLQSISDLSSSSTSATRKSSWKHFLYFWWHHPPMYESHHRYIPSDEKSFLLLPLQHVLRQIALKITFHPIFRWLEFLSCCTNIFCFVVWPLAIVSNNSDDPDLIARHGGNDNFVDFIFIVETIINSIFVFELIIGIVSFGIWSPSANEWNKKDHKLFISKKAKTETAAAFTSNFLSDIAHVGYYDAETYCGCDCHSKEETPHIRLAYVTSDLFNFFDTLARVAVFLAIFFSPALRFFRIFRSARLMTLLPEAQAIFVGFARALPVSIIRFFPVCAIVWFVLSLTGVQLFQGTFGYCNDLSIELKSKCIGVYESNTTSDILTNVLIDERNKQNQQIVMTQQWNGLQRKKMKKKQQQREEENLNTTAAAGDTNNNDNNNNNNNNKMTLIEPPTRLLPRAWFVRAYSYDSLPKAMLSLFVVSSYATTSNMLFNVWNAAKLKNHAAADPNQLRDDIVKKQGRSSFAPVFIIVVWFLCTVWAANGFCGVLLYYMIQFKKFQQVSNDWPPEARQGLRIGGFLRSLLREAAEMRPNSNKKWSVWCHEVLTFSVDDLKEEVSIWYEEKKKKKNDNNNKNNNENENEKEFENKSQQQQQQHQQAATVNIYNEETLARESSFNFSTTANAISNSSFQFQRTTTITNPHQHHNNESPFSSFSNSPTKQPQQQNNFESNNNNSSFRRRQKNRQQTATGYLSLGPLAALTVDHRWNASSAAVTSTAHHYREQKQKRNIRENQRIQEQSQNASQDENNDLTTTTTIERANSNSLFSIFDIFSVICIVANFVSSALRSPIIPGEENERTSTSEGLNSVTTIIILITLCFFTIELLMKFIAYRHHLLDPSHSSHSDFIFDVVVVIAGWIDSLGISKIAAVISFLRILNLRRQIGPRFGMLKLLDAMVNVRRHIIGALYVLLFGLFFFAVLGVVLFAGTETPLTPSPGWTSRYRNLNNTPAAMKLIFDAASPDTYIAFMTDLIVGVRKNPKNPNLARNEKISSTFPFLGSLPEGILGEEYQPPSSEFFFTDEISSSSNISNNNVVSTRNRNAKQQQQEQQENINVKIDRNSPSLVNIYFVVSMLLLAIVGPSFVGTIMYDVIILSSSNDEEEESSEQQNKNNTNSPTTTTTTTTNKPKTSSGHQRIFVRVCFSWLMYSSDLTLSATELLENVIPKFPREMTQFPCAAFVSSSSSKITIRSSCMLRFLRRITIPLTPHYIKQQEQEEEEENEKNKNENNKPVEYRVSYDTMIVSIAVSWFKMSPVACSETFQNENFRHIANKIRGGNLITLAHVVAVRILENSWIVLKKERKRKQEQQSPTQSRTQSPKNDEKEERK